ncbi:OmpA family protein [Actinomadura kijaniata]|uniref:OmpA family protein n=1 Tax=Actinomadura kijaniata TaxID=46161 RepID=UPI003F1AC996
METTMRRIGPLVSCLLAAVAIAVVVPAPSPALALTGSPPAPPSPPPSPPADAVGAIEDLVAEIETPDGAARESTGNGQMTVALAGDVLFALDKATLTPKAKQQLQVVADKIGQRAAQGVIRVEGHTDDQGSDAYNDQLSLARAQTVQRALQPLLTGRSFTFKTAGFGERRPTVPNAVDGSPLRTNQARNRRVEIIFAVRS